MWISVFFIKFEGNIENVRGEAENIFNITQEFNEKKPKSTFFPYWKTKKKVGKRFWTDSSIGNN